MTAATPARHTFVLSDLHISDVEVADPRRPLWRRYKHAGSHADPRLLALLTHIRGLAAGEPSELILNGDVFDFDSILSRPAVAGGWRTSWLERARGLAPEEAKSCWKLHRILEHHRELIDALRAWVQDGHTLIFVIGNHDLELHWPSAQRILLDAIGGPTPDAVRVCAWFVRCGDTLVTHGNQLDDYCVCQDPLHPYVEVRGVPRVRSPFGNLAGKLILNGMGLFNPHVDDSFIKPPMEYLRFFFQHIARTQPFVLWSWLWAATATLVLTLDEGFRPAIRDPRTLAAREEREADKARVSTGVLRALQAASVHSAVFSPWKLARELWLDRLLLLLLVAFLVIEVGSTLHLLGGPAGIGAQIALALLLPPFLLYAWSVRSNVAEADAELRAGAVQLAMLCGARRVIMGHTHVLRRDVIQGIEYLNTGHWAPAWRDLECTVPVGLNGFAWLQTREDGSSNAELRVFEGGSSTPVTERPPPRPVRARPAWVERLRGATTRQPGSVKLTP